MKKQNLATKNKPLYIVLISVHGLIRGHDLELGRDADTGGQTKYVVELARALGEHPGVEQVVLLTRRVVDSQVSADYAEVFELLSDKASIVRIACGEDKYLRKEMLWDSLENFSDNVLAYLKSQPRMPDVLHSHYADAGYVGSRLSHQLGIPLVHTGHSLGRNKRQQLLASGIKRSEIESIYHISRRIEAEETTLGTAERVITSTQQEIEQQYGLYDFYQPERMRVISPGTDLTQFFPPQGDEKKSPMAMALKRYLKQPNKPMILALSRPDPKKNIVALIEAYGGSPALQQAANLVIVAGNRDDIQEMETVSKGVLTEILLAIDKHDLYGKLAYPKHHKPQEVAVLYRLAASSGGVFVNPALTEPFGLTLIEAAASGLPIVATEDGGPKDIVANCNNGILIDPLDTGAIAAALNNALHNRPQWRKWARSGVLGVRRHYSWDAHVAKYLKGVHKLLHRHRKQSRRHLAFSLHGERSPMPLVNRALISDIDNTLIGDADSLKELLALLNANAENLCWGVATGRCLIKTLQILEEHAVERPDILICSVGTDIYYGATLSPDKGWHRHIAYRWRPEEIREQLGRLDFLELQEPEKQMPFKVSYYLEDDPELLVRVHQTLQAKKIRYHLVYSHGQFLDILPYRASKGKAIRYLSYKWNIPLADVMVCGDSGNDASMLRGDTNGLVVANYSKELEVLRGLRRIFFSKREYAAGIINGMQHYDFIGGQGDD